MSIVGIRKLFETTDMHADICQHQLGPICISFDYVLHMWLSGIFCNEIQK